VSSLSESFAANEFDVLLHELDRLELRQLFASYLGTWLHVDVANSRPYPCFPFLEQAQKDTRLLGTTGNTHEPTLEGTAP
jgi:hypothetical protein